MKLVKASPKAVKYACMHFHYAKSLPVNTTGYAVFNDRSEWCGVVLFGTGASPQIGKAFELPQGAVLELVRMALNGKQGSTSKVMACAIRLARKDFPLAKLLVSYADSEQGHTGTIYQATNWHYTGSIKSHPVIEGRHNKSMGGSLKAARKLLRREPEVYYPKPKHKYIYPLDKSLVPMCKALAKPYPKKSAPEAQTDERHSTTVKDGGAVPTPALT